MARFRNLALALLAWPGALSAQAGDVDGTRLQPRTDSLYIYAIRGTDTVPTGRVTDQITVLQTPDGEVLRRVYRTVDRVFGGGLDTIIDLRANLVPRHYHTRNERGEALVTFANDSVTGYALLAPGDSVPVRSAIPPGTINGASFDLLLRASSLALGKSWELNGFDASARTLVPISAQVVGKEEVDGEACWHIQAAFGGLGVHFWVGERTRRLCRQIMVLRPDLELLFSRDAPKPPTGTQRET